MAKVTRVEKRQRGFFGWVFMLLFWLFNVLMLFMMIGAIAELGESSETLRTDAEKVGFAVGSAIGVGMLLVFWLVAGGILALLMWATAGRKVVVETTEG